MPKAFERWSRRLACAAAVVGCWLTAAAAVHAAPAYTVSNLSAPFGLGNPPATLGFEFVATTGIVVTDLGLFDSESNGLIEGHEVGLWSAAGMLLASATVPAGTGAPLTNQFRYVDIADVVLSAGTYRIGALFSTSADPLLFPGQATGFDTADEITFVRSTFAFSGTLSDPDSSASAAPGYFGPNFLFSVNAVPEAGAAPLALTALALLAVARRSRSARSRKTVAAVR